MQSMGSQGGGGRNKNNGTHSGNHPTVGQNTVICLTLDEVQNQLGDLGKPLSSMNLDELLQNVWTVEVNQSRPSDVEDTAQTSRAVVQPQANLPLAGDLSNRTVDEVWRDIQGSNNDEDSQDKLGEMTLEDFLVKAGVVIEASKKRNTAPTVAAVNPNMAVPQHVPWIQYVQPQYVQTQQGIVGIYMPAPNMPQPLHMGGGAAVDVQYADGPSAMMEALPDSKRPWKKRGTPEDLMERTIERRQKRMIKNRESAARSRARKQAYTSELENKVSQLEEENEKLRKLKEIEKILAEAPPPERNCQSRRTFSASF